MRIRQSLFFFLLFIPFHSTLAIPNSFFGNGFFGPVIPATPVFGADLTRDFFAAENWRSHSFPGPWEVQSDTRDESIQKMTANPTLFGAVPMSVYAIGNETEGTREITIHFLDAGLYFGYLAGGEKNRDQRLAGSDRRSEFSRLYRKIHQSLKQRLEDGCGPGRMGTRGTSDALRTVYSEYQWENFLLRLIAKSNHSVSLTITTRNHSSDSFLDPELAMLSPRERERVFANTVTSNSRGDRRIDDLPVMVQGDTPYCAVHALAMAGGYLGLTADPQTLASGAEFRNTGSARGSDLPGLYRGVAEELDMRLKCSSKFDADRIMEAIDSGLPVIVWRRVSRQRELFHNEYGKKYASDPSCPVPVIDRDTIASFPDRSSKGSPSHSSVITGYNPIREEVIFSEPWGTFARDRRMSFREMEATVYSTFIYRW